MNHPHALGRRFVVALAFAAGCVLWPASGIRAQQASQVARLIEQLDDDSFEVREAAEKALAAIGEPARAALEIAAKDSAAERSQRATRLLRDLRKLSLGLRYVGNIQHPELTGAVTVAASPDGRFLYVPAWQIGMVNAYRRDPNLGTLECIQSLSDPGSLRGALRLRLNADASRATAPCIHSKTVVLFTRDADSGMLKIADVARGGEGGVAFQWPTDAMFSRDGNFLYAVEPRGGFAVVYSVGQDDKLKLVETNSGSDDCFQGARAIAMHPDGKTMYVIATTGKLTVAGRDPATGKLSIRQVLQDEHDNIRGLAGAWDVCCSDDGKHVYTCSGRNGGDHAVSAFRVEDDGKLAVMQEFVNDVDELRDFAGGNKIAVSPDGLSVYASGTVSGGLACFSRDPKTGRLRYLHTLRDRTTGQSAVHGVCGIGFSPDSKFLYVTLESDAAISIFARDAARR